jgi:hypothetical protein
VLVVVVASGDLNAEGAEVLDDYLHRVQAGNDIVVDLWDVTSCDPEGVTILEASKKRWEEAGWGFAVVADPDGPCHEALTAGAGATIVTFADRHAARAALSQL